MSVGCCHDVQGRSRAAALLPVSAGNADTLPCLVPCAWPLRALVLASRDLRALCFTGPLGRDGWLAGAAPGAGGLLAPGCSPLWAKCCHVRRIRSAAHLGTPGGWKRNRGNLARSLRGEPRLQEKGGPLGSWGLHPWLFVQRGGAACTDCGTARCGQVRIRGTGRYDPPVTGMTFFMLPAAAGRLAASGLLTTAR